MHVLQHDRRMALRRQTTQHFAQPRDLLCAQDVAVDFRPLCQLLLNCNVFDVDRNAAFSLRTGLLLGEIARDPMRLASQLRMADMSFTRSIRR